MAEQTAAGIQAALTGSRERLAALARFSEVRWRRQPPGDGWSAAAVLAHLRASDAIIAPRLLQTVVRDEPPLLGWDERRWQEVADYEGLPAARLIAGFLLRREELLHALGRMPDESWQRKAQHEALGPLTLLQMAGHLAEHEQEHLDQIDSVLAGPA